MKDIKYFRDYKSIICLDWNLPNIDFFTHNNLPIIAADGAADRLYEIGIEPRIIIGDLDSVNLSNHKNIEVIYVENQNSSDFEKSINYVDYHNLAPSLILGANGGFLDHILNNINIILRNEYIFYSPPIIGVNYQAPVEINLNLDINTKISLFGFSRAIVTTKGLKWNLNQNMLEFPGFNSSLNRTISENISIDLLKGKLLLLIYDNEIIDSGVG